jgi:hypothetical protein
MVTMAQYLLMDKQDQGRLILFKEKIIMVKAGIEIKEGSYQDALNTYFNKFVR